MVKRFLRLQNEWSIRYCERNRHIKCSCKLFKSEVFSCSDTTAVLKARHKKFILDSLVHCRRLVDAKPEYGFGLS